jgi:UDP-N-acetyl-D-galactosamine dehydrogenase
MAKEKIAIIGLGYVGLPLAVAFAEKFSVIGFDINKNRINELQSGNDHTLEIDTKQLRNVLVKNNKKGIGLFCTSDKTIISDCNFYIVTVPTPVDKYNRPDLTPLYKASETVGSVLKKGDIVVYESTVYPGATEEECVPVLEKFSGLKFNKDFFAGYSPERINPGDKVHTVRLIKKVTSGSTPVAAEKINSVYKKIITAGTFKATSIKVAEAAKVIENSQRDINIAFMNELSKIFTRLEIDTNEVLEAAATKWNFLPFKPGLVGGHCIGVDPYYLAQKAQETGYNPEIILSGRRINDGMGEYVAGELVKAMVHKGIPVNDSKVLIMGLTFKENCPDVRNTKVVDIVKALKSYHMDITIWDPWADPQHVYDEYALKSSKSIDLKNQFAAIIVAVSHHQFYKIDLNKLKQKNGAVVFDVKGVYPKSKVDVRL